MVFSNALRISSANAAIGGGEIPSFESCKKKISRIPQNSAKSNSLFMSTTGIQVAWCVSCAFVPALYVRMRVCLCCVRLRECLAEEQNVNFSLFLRVFKNTAAIAREFLSFLSRQLK